MKITPLESNESIFSNADSLSPDFVPALLPFRENEQREIARLLEPLLNNRPARNIFVFGKAGIGKTHAVKKVIEGLAEQGLLVIYVNCGVFSESSAVMEKIALKLGLSGKADVSRLKERLSRPCVFVFDEVDRAKDDYFLYALAEEIRKSAFLLVSNKEGFLAGLDERIRSRLLPKTIEFRQYSENELRAILEERRKYAFFENTWSSEAKEIVCRETVRKGDLRFGLVLIREAGENAEKEASRLVAGKHAEKAVKEMN